MPFSTTTTTLLHLLFLLFLSHAPLLLSSTTHSRRILHQPFFPVDSPPPTPPPVPSPPSPPTPKYPFSTSTPPDSEFFPTYPSPPPPPAPSSLASFPANISSLNLPQPSKSKTVSTKLIATAVAAIIAAVVVVLIAVFLHLKKRRSRAAFSDTKTSRSDTSTRYNHPPIVSSNSDRTPNNHRSVPKLNRPSQTSSEFLYLGTLVNSHGGLDPHNNAQHNARRNNTNSPSTLNPRKLDSPELQPLPPLIRQPNNNYQNVETGSAREEDSEDFYSPRESVGGRESSIGAGSASRRAFAAVEVANLNGSSSSSSSFLSSSSGSGSPARSVSLSISPPVSPKRSTSRPKSPDLEAVELQMAPPVAPAPPPPPPPPPRPVFMGLGRDSLSPSLSPSPSPRSSVSPERLPGGLNMSSPRISNVSDQPLGSPVRMGSSVQQNVLVFNPFFRFSNALDENVGSPERISNPVKQNELDFDPPPPISDASNQNAESPGRVTSPVKDNNQILEPHLRTSNVSDQSTESPESVHSPGKDNGLVSEQSFPVLNQSVEPPDTVTISVLQNEPISESYLGTSNVPDQSMESSARISSPMRQGSPVSVPSVPPPPPPPPPPPLPPSKYWESPRTPTPPARRSTTEPPVLVTPLRPMVIESPTMISPMQLPSQLNSSILDEANDRSEDTPKPKLKPLHWDKVRASSDREMVWDQLRSSSFKLNEEMIETLFIVKPPNPTPTDTTRRQILPSPNQESRVLDPKKSQNIAILLKALHVTVDEVCEALLEGNADTLGTELLESLLKMAPTKEEEHKLKEHKDDSPVKLGPAERFLKEVLDVPFAFKRVDAMLYISNFDSEVEYLKKSFETLEAACEELRNSRMFLKLLEAVLKTGNRMNVGTNRGDAHAFKLDTLLKLVDVKGADGKTTLLHFVVQEITRSEGARLSTPNENQASSTNDDVKCRKLGLQVVSNLASDLTNVKKAAAMDSDILNSDVLKLSKGLEKVVEVVRLNETVGSQESSSPKFSEAMNGFLKMAEEEIIRIQAQESVALTLVKEITEYFHGNSTKEEAHPFRIFMVVRDFLSVLDRVCKEVGMINERTIVSSAHKFPVPVNPMLQPVSSGFPGKRQYSSSDDESFTP